MSLWWLQPGWKETPCSLCGATIWPEGDPDWGLCARCFDQRHDRESEQAPTCDVCHQHPAIASAAGKAVCSVECHEAVMAAEHGAGEGSDD